MDVTAEETDSALDPRIQIELENLNNATDDINKLETELDEAHTAFRQLLSDTTRRLKEITDKQGTSCIEKARCYYEALEMARQAQVQCQQQAQLFQRASEIHAAAKETVALAEARFISHQHEWNFDQAWQDMLNHATIKVMDAENQKAECGREHHKKAMLFHDAEKMLLQLEEKHRRSIIKARPYFEIKAQCDQMLATQKERVEHLQQTVKETKRNYATSLRTLEDISNQIHQRRRDYDIVVNGPREPGVGAELISSDICQKHGNELNDSNNHKIASVMYNKNSSKEKMHDIENPSARKEDTEKLDKRSVDGSECKSTQWELELQASLEKLNRSSLEQSLYVEGRDHTLNSADLRNGIKVDTVTTACYDFLPTEQPNAHSLNQLPWSTKSPVTLKNNSDIIDRTSFLQRSYSTINSSTPFCDRSNMPSQSNISKSLTNSPVNRGAPNFETKKAMNKAISADTSKYVPNSNSQLDIKDRNFEFPPVGSNFMEEHRSAPFPSVSQLPTSSQDDVALLSTRSGCNTLQKSASCSANSSPIRLKNTLTSPIRSNSKIKEQRFDEQYASGKLAIKTASIKELPLLSFFGQTSSALSAYKGKSCSMIDLDNKQNLKILLDNSRLGDIQAISVERLVNVRHMLVNDRPETKTNDVKK